MSGGKVYKPKPVSGFPEWLPEQRLVEQQWFDHIRRVFESYGFCNIETPSVEELDVIAAKGEVDKEIYVIERLHKEEGEKSEARLALHFDQTVPLARYVGQHWDKLVFPFKRYQMQRVWRGERPQAGRFREFYQCDIDVINNDTLPLHFDAEMPAIIWEVLSGLPGMEKESLQIRISNRKILFGLFETYLYDRDKVVKAVSIVDKLEKIKEAGVLAQLREIGIQSPALERIVEQIQRKIFSHSEIDRFAGFHDLSPTNTFMEGVQELKVVMQNLSHLPRGTVVADLSIARGLDYYTGTVYETVFTNDPGYGSICSGGRYDDLASSYINKKLPGVGISIGFSRLFARMVEKGAFGDLKRKSPADILMVLPSEEKRAEAAAAAQSLRANGLKVEMYHAPKKTGDQIKFADRKGIPYVWFPDINEVKNIVTGEQKPADPKTWMPEEKK